MPLSPVADLSTLHLGGLRPAGADVDQTNPLYDGPGLITALPGVSVMAELLASPAEERRQARSKTRNPNLTERV
jgi:hypothetical protein